MKAALSPQTRKETTNNRLAIIPPNVSNGKLLVKLMQALQAAQKKAEENPEEAELNRTTMSDNNDDRIIYTLSFY